MLVYVSTTLVLFGGVGQAGGFVLAPIVTTMWGYNVAYISMGILYTAFSLIYLLACGFNQEEKKQL